MTTIEASTLGLSRSRTRSQEFRRPFRGVIAPANWLGSPEFLAIAYAKKMQSHQWFSHATAGILHGMRLPLAIQRREEIHVSASSGHRAPRGRRIQGHIGTANVIVLRGLPVVSAVTSWCQLALTLSHEELIIAADGLLARQNPVATMGILRRAVVDWRGKRGYQNLLEAMPLVRERTDSARETMLRLLILRSGMPEPIVNAPIRSRTGHVVAHADLAYPEFNLVLEYDGDQHRTDKDQYYLDVKRLERITREGWRVIRINRQHMASPSSLAALIREALDDAVTFNEELREPRFS